MRPGALRRKNCLWRPDEISDRHESFAPVGGSFRGGRFGCDPLESDWRFSRYGPVHHGMGPKQWLYRLYPRSGFWRHSCRDPGERAERDPDKFGSLLLCFKCAASVVKYAASMFRPAGKSAADLLEQFGVLVEQFEQQHGRLGRLRLAPFVFGKSIHPAAE